MYFIVLLLVIYIVTQFFIVIFKYLLHY